ncbi:hypothetical protein [Butyricicoccus pullicaecorum]|uniref:hypothetical protein n=1 Tax=Butyricicoccus pullicaecorum TaxID=501571 RepID=UPI003990D709
MRKSTKKEQKKRDPQVAQFSGKTNQSVGLSFLFVLVETQGGHWVSKGEFRACGLDQVSPGRTRELVPWTPI